MTTARTTSGAHPHPGGLATLAGRPVARIGHGAMQLERGDDEPALAVLRRAAELGFDHIDTAEFYGAGRVNSRIRAAPHPYPGHLVLAGKVGATSDPGGQYGLRPAQSPPNCAPSWRRICARRAPG
ncbi:aldo/keto reductase [Stenotrophomonas sp. NPDC087984]